LSKFRENEGFILGSDSVLWNDPFKVANAIVMEVNNIAG
jgi:hypothetical protein